MCEPSMTIWDRAEELANACGVSYRTALFALWHMVGQGYGVSKPIEVSIEDYKLLQKLLEEKL